MSHLPVEGVCVCVRLNVAQQEGCPGTGKALRVVARDDSRARREGRPLLTDKRLTSDQCAVSLQRTQHVSEYKIAPSLCCAVM